jgi:beta-mannosidase
MASTMSPDFWGIQGGQNHDNCTIVFENLNDCGGTNVMAQRNYPCDNMIQAFFGDVDLSRVGENAFRRQLYLCMISQSIWMKGEIEMKRNENIFGLLIWQLNENWPTGGWGLVEYGSDEIGQVIGGRWKPLMYMLKRSLFRDVIATCGEGGLCYCRNDSGFGFTGNVSIERYDFTTGSVSHLLDQHVKLNGGAIGRFFFFSYYL